jgi:hypothetical protein
MIAMKICYLKNTIPVIPLLPSFDRLIKVIILNEKGGWM